MSRLFWHEVEQALAASLGGSLHLSAPGSVGGGCINQAFRVESSQGPFFVKVNSADGLEMFQAEAEGLEELQQAESLRIPAPLAWGLADGQAFLVLEYLELGGSGSPAVLAEGLVAQHRITANRFGWYRDNTIGATPQPNRQEDEWLVFWRERRLKFQLELALERGAGSRLVDRGERLLEALPALLSGHRPEASLLHGDLWGGNYAYTRAGEPVLFDPAVYYGDREADLAMTELFGGFSPEFYAAYRHAWPLDAGYPLRRKLYNLYHVLNHYNLFGGGYLSQARGMIDALLAEVA
ncbi:MAG TPA: fructosamine kinase family protein [Gammaproteobacteria bacterium]|nr:fructosamine kinase family protein [Gammaproteobacteria bacterium]